MIYFEHDLFSPVKHLLTVDENWWNRFLHSFILFRVPQLATMLSAATVIGFDLVASGIYILWDVFTCETINFPADALRGSHNVPVCFWGTFGTLQIEYLPWILNFVQFQIEDFDSSSFEPLNATKYGYDILRRVNFDLFYGLQVEPLTVNLTWISPSRH